MYKRIDEQNKSRDLDKTNEIIRGLEEKDINLIANNLHNAFEEVMQDTVLLNNIKNELNQNGAMGSLMTGSGSCVYGIFDSKKRAKECYSKLKDKYEAYICTSYNSKRGNLFEK